MQILLISFVVLTVITIFHTHKFISHVWRTLYWANQPLIRDKLKGNPNFINNCAELSKQHHFWAQLWTPFALITSVMCLIEIATGSINLEFLAIMMATTATPVLTFKYPAIHKPTRACISHTSQLLKLEVTNVRLVQLCKCLEMITNNQLILNDNDVELIIYEARLLTTLSQQLNEFLEANQTNF